jgi:hypothetical protein
LLPSVLFITENAILFGDQAEQEAIRAEGSVREAFSSPKQYLSTYDLADALLAKEMDPTGQFTARKLLPLFIAHLLERAGAHAVAGSCRGDTERGANRVQMPPCLDQGVRGRPASFSAMAFSLWSWDHPGGRFCK